MSDVIYFLNLPLRKLLSGVLYQILHTLQCCTLAHIFKHIGIDEVVKITPLKYTLSRVLVSVGTVGTAVTTDSQKD